MSNENIDISFTQNGATEVKRDINDIANSSNSAADAVDKLNKILKNLTSIGDMVNSHLYTLKLSMTDMGIYGSDAIKALGSDFIMLGNTTNAIKQHIIGLGSNFIMVGEDALKLTSNVTGAGAGFITMSNGASSLKREVTGLGDGFILVGRAYIPFSHIFADMQAKANMARDAIKLLTFDMDGYTKRMTAGPKMLPAPQQQLRITDQTNNRSVVPYQSAADPSRALVVQTQAGLPALRTYTAQLRNAEAATEQLSNKTSGSNLELHGFLRTLLSFGVIRQMAADVVHLADEWTRMGNRLRQVSKDQNDLKQLQDQAYISAQRTRSGMEEMATLYTRTSMATESLKLSQKDLWDVTETVAMSMKLNGGSTEETAQAMRQLSQAFNKGKLDGDEFRSIMENAPQLQKLFADSLHVTKGELYQMSHDGELSLGKLITAIKQGGPAIREQFANSIPTAEEGMVALANAMEQFVGKLNEATGATAIFYMAAQVFAANVWLAVPAIGALGTALTIAFGPSIIAQIRSFGVATMTALGPWGLLAVAVVGLGLALFALKDKFNQLDPATKAAATTFAVLVGVIGGGITLFLGIPAIIAGVSTAFGVLGAAFAATSAVVTGTMIPAMIATAPIWVPVVAGIAAITAAVYIFVKYKEQWADVFKYVGKAIDTVTKIFQALPGIFTKAGRDTLLGLIAGLIGEVSHVIATVQAIGDDIINKFKAKLGIHSPSRVFIEHGENIGRGLIIGMDNTLSGVMGTSQRLAAAANSAQYGARSQNPTEATNELRNDVLQLTNRLLTEAEQKTLDLASGTDVLNRALTAKLITQQEYATLMERLKTADTVDPNAALREQTNQIVENLMTEDERRAKNLISSSNILKQALDAGILTTEQYNQGLERLNKNLAPEQKATSASELKAMQEDMQKEIGLLKLGSHEREIQRELQSRINELRQQGIELSPLEQQELENSIRQLDKVRQQSELVGGILDRAFSKAEDAFMNFVKTGKLDFKDLIGSLLEDLARFTAEETFIKPLKDKLHTIIMDYLGTMNSGSSGGGWGSIFNTIGSFFGGGGGGGGTGIDPELMTFANGGTFNVGGFGGVDSQLVKFRASPKEKIRVYRSNEDSSNSQSGSSNQPINYYSIDARGATNPKEVEDSVNRALDQRVPGIIKTARQETIKDVQQIATRQKL